MKKVDYNIEFAHIYTNENFSEEHFQAAQIARDKIREFEKAGKSFCVTILVDNYNSTENLLSVSKFTNELKEMSVEPDFVVYEAELTRYKEWCLASMQGKLKRQYEKYIEINHKCPCSFLVAIWHLSRLGVINIDDIINRVSESPKPTFYGDKILTILPQRYGAVESKAIEIIRSSDFLKELPKMEHLFY